MNLPKLCEFNFRSICKCMKRWRGSTYTERDIEVEFTWLEWKRKFDREYLHEIFRRGPIAFKRLRIYQFEKKNWFVLYVSSLSGVISILRLIHQPPPHQQKMWLCAKLIMRTSSIRHCLNWLEIPYLNVFLIQALLLWKTSTISCTFGCESWAWYTLLLDRLS